MALVFEGKVIPGLKHGAAFVERYKDMLETACGFSPFPGTLNVECSEAPVLPTRSNFISGWTEMGVNYGSVWCFPCTLNGLAAALVVPDKSSHGPKVVEIVSPYCLKTRLGLKRGDNVKIEVLDAKH